MRRWRIRLGLLLGTVVALTAGLVPLTAGPASAAALPSGFMYLLNYGDQAATGQYLGMDIADPAGNYTGHVYLNPAKTGRMSQQWEAVFVTDTVVKLRNRQNGACIARVVAFPDGRNDTGLVDCNAVHTDWTVNAFFNPTTYVFRTKIGDRAQYCLTSSGPPGARYVSAYYPASDCTKEAGPPHQWQTTVVK